jgi:hypothetical protein
VNAANFNQSGGTFNMNLPSGNDGYYIGVAAGRSVNYTMSGSAIINANASGTANTNSFLAIGRGAGNTAYSNTLNVTGAANLNVGNAAGMAGELLIAYDDVSNGTLNVTGGAVTVGTGKTDNKIYFFKAGSGAGYTANLTQSGGTVTANGIQFGGTSGTYDLRRTSRLAVASFMSAPKASLSAPLPATYRSRSSFKVAPSARPKIGRLHLTYCSAPPTVALPSELPLAAAPLRISLFRVFFRMMTLSVALSPRRVAVL